MFAIHFLLASGVAFGALVLPSAAWAYGALLLFGSLSLGLLRTSPATFLLFIPLLALRMSEFISGAAIESGAYMIESTTYGHPTGAFARLLLIYILFFLAATMVVESAWPRVKPMFREAIPRWEAQAKLVWVGLLIVMVLGTAYLIRLGLNNGFPLISHIDRFVYLEKVNSPIYQALLRNRLVIVPFIGALFAVPSYRSRGVFLLVWLLAVSILFGEKFGSLLMILSVFGIPAGLAHIAHDRPIPINLIAGLAISIVTITAPAVLIAYGALNDFDGAVQRYGQRVALQGQLWYVADNKYLAFAKLDDQAISEDMASWVRPSEQDATEAGTRFGLYYVMQRFTSSRLLGWTMDGGNGFVFSLYPYLLISMGIVGVIAVSTILAIYHALIMRFLAVSFAQASWIAGIFIGRVMSSVYATYSTGFLWNVFGVKTLATLVVGVFLVWEGRRPASVSRNFVKRMNDRLNESTQPRVAR